ncbi:hypothetical protein [Bradyrhizobium sp. SRS-191]|uniref:hypothetical protein n=1 Tax=Bradyrhizobium sp. SRS-191 TaxID=2962606 RepID=UPI00211E9163|nr:hypothetical protein [Bradyrhizobium sp. SRS-191]
MEAHLRRRALRIEPVARAATVGLQKQLEVSGLVISPPADMWRKLNACGGAASDSRGIDGMTGIMWSTAPEDRRRNPAVDAHVKQRPHNPRRPSAVPPRQQPMSGIGYDEYVTSKHQRSRGPTGPGLVAETLIEEEGAGNAGRWPQPMARLQKKKQAAVTTGRAGQTRHSLRGGLNAYLALSSVSGYLATVAPGDHHHPKA